MEEARLVENLSKKRSATSIDVITVPPRFSESSEVVK
jgi:hypothetical protein